MFSVLLFKRRAWPAWVGLGFGAGRAWEEADGEPLFSFNISLIGHAMEAIEVYFLLDIVQWGGLT